MNKNKTPTQLMIEAASARSARERSVEWRPGIEELARLIAETLMAQVPEGAEGELNAWLRTSAGAQALRESWPRAVEAYLARGPVGADVTL
jgi:hypothetical protein